MDYKEEYQNALERAKMILCNLPEGSSSQRDNETIFPQLKESEDERIRKELIEAIERARVFDIDKEVADRWIAYLEKQKKQKPAEWSEEDNRHINTIIRAIHGAGNITPIEGELAEKWFKSLRPSWKPSKEQMETLKNCAYGVFQNGDGPALRELYNDLEKLCYE